MILLWTDRRASAVTAPTSCACSSESTPGTHTRRYQTMTVRANRAAAERELKRMVAAVQT
jgi:hypothetical protein